MTDFQDQLLSSLTGEAHMWLAPDTVHDSEIADAEGLLDECELERYRAFRFHSDSIRYLAAHALLRTVLSRYVDRPPCDWRFISTKPAGRPELMPESGIPPLRFNLSHTRGLMACLIVNKTDAGVDVEEIQPVGDLVTLACKVLNSGERAKIGHLTAAERPARFAEYWTLKEAYLKALETGLSISRREDRSSSRSRSRRSSRQLAALDRPADTEPRRVRRP